MSRAHCSGFWALIFSSTTLVSISSPSFRKSSHCKQKNRQLTHSEIIGASLSEPHTSRTTLHKCVCIREDSDILVPSQPEKWLQFVSMYSSLSGENYIACYMKFCLPCSWNSRQWQTLLLCTVCVPWQNSKLCIACSDLTSNYMVISLQGLMCVECNNFAFYKS